MTTKPLTLSLADTIGCKVTYNVNRFEVYHANGWMMTAAYSKTDLKRQLAANSIKGAQFDSMAQRKYLAAE